MTSDELGHYRIVAGVRGDSVTVLAQDGYDNRAYAETSWGTARIRLATSTVHLDLVLDHSDPI